MQHKLFSHFTINEFDFENYSYYSSGWEFNKIELYEDSATLFLDNETNNLVKVDKFFVDEPKMIVYYKKVKDTESK